MKTKLFTFISLVIMISCTSCSSDSTDPIDPRDEILNQRKREREVFGHLSGNTYRNEGAKFDVKFKTYTNNTIDVNYCGATFYFKEPTEFKGDSLNTSYYLTDDNRLEPTNLSNAKLVYKDKELLIGATDFTKGNWNRIIE